MHILQVCSACPSIYLSYVYLPELFINNTFSTAKAFVCHHDLLLLTIRDKNQENQEGLRFQAQMSMIAFLRSITDNLFELEHMGLS